MSVLLHLSDTHFGTERAEVVEALLRMTRRERIDVALWSGDITQRARTAEFDAAARFGSRLRVPVLLAIPGNHDLPLFNLLARWRHPYRGYCRVFGRELEPVYRTSDLLVVMLNTTRPRRHVDGEVSAAQVERVAAQLRAATPSQLRIVVVHQPVGVTAPAEVRNLLHGHQAAVGAWHAAGADLVLGGHIHLPYLCLLRAEGGRRLWTLQAGTAVSSRTRRGVPNSVNVIRYRAAERQCVVERWDYEAAEFRAVVREVIALDDR
jgi:3',5'-cyclic AMP phosphodiesterase CpdA